MKCIACKLCKLQVHILSQLFFQLFINLFLFSLAAADAVVVIVNSGTLTAGQIAGIVVGSAAFIVLAAILIVVMIVGIKKVRDRNLNK